MNDLDTIRILGGPAFRDWLASLLTAEQLGSELVLSLPTTRDQADANRVLAAAERAGWIQRSFFSPSQEQMAFYGLAGRCVKALTSDEKQHHTEWWCWRAADRDAIRAYAGDPPPANLQLGDEVRYAPAFVAQIQGGRSMAQRRGRVVGYAFGGKAARVRWDDDPEEERARESPYWEGEGDGERMVPYTPRAVMVGAVRRVGPAHASKAAVVPAAVPAVATAPKPQPKSVPPAPAVAKEAPRQLSLFTI